MKFLAYGFLAVTGHPSRDCLHFSSFDPHPVPMGGGAAFQDFDGVVVFPGAFEETADPVELDQRERQFHTASKQGRPFIFLLPSLPDPGALRSGGAVNGLFRRVASYLGISWWSDTTPYPALESAIPEFSDYIGKYGAGYVYMEPPLGDPSRTSIVCRDGETVYGMAINDQIFFLPCTGPSSSQQAAEMASAAVAAVIAYRKRVSRELPEWVDKFAFDNEERIRAKAEEHRTQLKALEREISAYRDFKAVLCLQSDPLVEAIRKIVDHFFDLRLTVDGKKIEDATLCDAEGKIQAVIEIKGINGNFDRKMVNQVDGHRERLGLPAEVPGIAIVNTFRSEESLGGKDQPPNSEIIQKASQDNVLLIRTLDLLRFADLVERGVKTKEDFRNVLLKEHGWLCVTSEGAEVRHR